jgi:hypothetical protein
MQHYIEDQRLPNIKKRLQKNKMTTAGDGQPFRYALDNAENDDFNQ